MKTKTLIMAGWFFLLTHQVVVENKDLRNQETSYTTFVTDTLVPNFPDSSACIAAEKLFEPSDTLRTGPFTVSPCINTKTGETVVAN